jgi:hypothetical protein
MNQRGIRPIATRGANGAKPAPLGPAMSSKEILTRPAYAGMVQTADSLRLGE